VIKWKKINTDKRRFGNGFPRTEDRPPWRSSVSTSDNVALDRPSIPTDAVLWRVAHMLYKKNEKYGDSALNPMRVFYNGGDDAADMIRIRIDDKISRLARGSEGIENDLDIYHDLIGYLALLVVAIDNKGVDEE